MRHVLYILQSSYIMQTRISVRDPLHGDIATFMAFLMNNVPLHINTLLTNEGVSRSLIITLS